MLSSSDYAIENATSLETLHELSITEARDVTQFEPPFGDRADDSVMFPYPQLGSHPTLPLDTDIPTFVSQTGAGWQQHSREIILEREKSFEESDPQETSMGAADEKLSANPHLSDLARLPSGENLVRTECSGVSLCPEPADAITQTTFEDVQEAEPSEQTILAVPSPLGLLA